MKTVESANTWRKVFGIDFFKRGVYGRTKY